MAIAHQFTLRRAAIGRIDLSRNTRYALGPCGRGDDGAPSVAEAVFPDSKPHEPSPEIGPGIVLA